VVPSIFVLCFTFTNFNDTNTCLKQNNLIIIFYILNVLTFLPISVPIFYGVYYGLYYGVYYMFIGVKECYKYSKSIIQIEPILDVV
jgi:hypothetical protein